MKCSFSQWYPVFQQSTIKSKIIKLPNEFIEYLLQDGVVLPSDGLSQDRPSVPATADERPLNDVTSSGDEDEESWSDCDDESITLPEFPELQRKVEEYISELGGFVFPKLNWSCPKDACWISSTGTLKCSSFSDICLLLKSSDFIVHDLTHAFDCCEDCTDSQPPNGFELVLRKWTEISPASEFRCFVRKNQLIAVSQRDATNHFEFLLNCQQKIHEDITRFYKTKVQSKFSEGSFVFDVYRYGDAKVKLVDINPFSNVTDSLLFTWQEIAEDLKENNDLNGVTLGEFRLAPQDTLQPSPFLSYQMPKDVIDVASRGDINKLMDYLELSKLT